MLKKEISIGDCRLSSPTMLAPLSGITLRPFRRLLRGISGQSLGLVVAPLISVEGLVRGNRGTGELVELHVDEKPVAVQLFGGDPVRMGEAVRMAQDKGADVIDINCGCPAPKVSRAGGGVALMGDPVLFTRVVQAAVKAARIPVTVKMRLGLNSGSLNAMQLAIAAQEEGAVGLVVHGRTAAQGYRGGANWEAVAEIAARLDIPVFGSGDLVNPQMVSSALNDERWAGVMVGRGAMGNPWIFRQAAALSHCGSDFLSEQLPVQEGDWGGLLELYLRLIMEEGIEDPQIAAYHLRLLAVSMVKGSPGAAGLRHRINCPGLRPEQIVEEVARFGTLCTLNC